MPSRGTTYLRCSGEFSTFTPTGKCANRYLRCCPNRFALASKWVDPAWIYGEYWFLRFSNRDMLGHLPRNELQERGLTVICLEEDPKFQDIYLSVFHATTHTFSGTLALKFVENHNVRKFVKMVSATFQTVKITQSVKV